MTDPASRPQSDGPPRTPLDAEPYREPDPLPVTDVAPAAHPAPGGHLAPADGAAQPAPGFDDRGRVRASKVSGVWVGLIATAVFLILLVIFIAQNSRRVSIHFFGWHGQFSLALTILLSAVIGVLLVAVPGTVRILQLRSALRKNGPGRSA